MVLALAARDRVLSDPKAAVKLLIALAVVVIMAVTFALAERRKDTWW